MIRNGIAIIIEYNYHIINCWNFNESDAKIQLYLIRHLTWFRIK